MMKVLLKFCTILSICLANNHFRIYDDYEKHECNRKCQPRSRKTCIYDLTVDVYYTNQAECLNCTNGNYEDCSNPQCIPGTGVFRKTIVYNGMLPGPTFTVCEGDTVVVNVYNALNSRSTTIHWHGLHQLDTPWMDGVPMVTQCEIYPYTTFQYKFSAADAGTFFYHSHSSVQRAEGAYGHIIIKKPDIHNPHQALYDIDINEHIISLLDWSVKPVEDLWEEYLRAKKPFRGQFTSVLINGHGRRRDNIIPLKKFIVKKGLRYRFRIVNACNIICLIKLSIDGHKLLVISSDGNDIIPKEVDIIILNASERYDFVLHADADIDSYAIRVTGTGTCNFDSMAVLEYMGCPSTELSFSNTSQTGDIISYANMTSIDPPEYWLAKKPDVKKYFVFGNTFYSKPIYNGLNADKVIFTQFINNITFVEPSEPLLLNSKASKKDWCNADNPKNCKEGYCMCTHVEEVDIDDTVEFCILHDFTLPINSNHPIHLHGYAFRLIGEGKFNRYVSLQEFKQMDKNGEIKRNFKHSIIKDTVTLPSSGYLIIKFKANNPGFWMFHCHDNFHSINGMGLALYVKPRRKKSIEVPKEFYTCGNYYN